MEQRVCEHIHPGVITIQEMLRKIDRLRLPLASRRDVESILVRQVSKEIDRAIPWQTGHGRRTAAISLMIGQAVGLTSFELHDLKLAALLHDIGLLMLPRELTMEMNGLDSEAYVTVQSHPRLGALLLEPFFFLREVSVLIAYHHERWDGSGYPYGIREDSSPLDREFSRLPMPLTPSASPKPQAELRETQSRSELSKSQPAPNLTRS